MRLSFTFHTSQINCKVGLCTQEKEIKKVEFEKQTDLTALKNECSRVECKNILISRTGSEGAVELFFLDDIGIIGNHTLGYCEFSINQICENKLPDKT
jgi:CRISPR/Cas system CSM-associated protein Csm4 (group 5 of RAMP superfamily)